MEEISLTQEELADDVRWEEETPQVDLRKAHEGGTSSSKLASSSRK